MDAIAFTQINNDLATSSTSKNNTDLSKSQLGVEDFLTLLTTQLANQNPMEPMSDLDFLAQMSSFSSLQEMHSLNKSFQVLANAQGMSSASNYLGKQVVVSGPNGNDISGTVTAVHSNSNNSMSITVDGEKFDLSSVKSVSLNAPAA